MGTTCPFPEKDTSCQNSGEWECNGGFVSLAVPTVRVLHTITLKDYIGAKADDALALLRIWTLFKTSICFGER
jgi:hypothetical protein